jgi:hypothetical protein
MLCQRPIIRRVTRIAVMLAISACTAVPIAHAQTANPQYGVSVAVIPFEVFSIGKEPTLGSETADLLTKHLALNPSIVCVDSRHINTLLQTGDYGAMTGTQLRQMAKLLNANCIITGTITKIRDEHSIDIEMYTTASSGPNFKTFSEGMEVKSLIETIATVLDQEIMEQAGQIPAAERPRVSIARQPSLQTSTGGFDVDRELLTAFGPMEQSPAKKSVDSVSTAKGAVHDAPTLTEETILDESETSIQPNGLLPGRADSGPAA